MKPTIIVQKRLVFETYLKMIGNSIDSNLFRNSYGIINGRKVDLTKNGELSCAFFVSSILKLCDFIQTGHLTVEGTEKDLVVSGWAEIKNPKIGCVIVYKNYKTTRGVHKHIGFYVGKNKAISNSFSKKSPQVGFLNKESVHKYYWYLKWNEKNK